MNKITFTVMLLLGSIFTFGQNNESDSNQHSNGADNLLMMNTKILIGGYGEVHYNQLLDKSSYNNGNLDVHRMVMLFGYNFNEKIQFISELEFEHVSEVYVEQAFLQYKINNYINLRAGLILIPMGIINEYHEPTTFNGVERPLIDTYIVPSTWREIGFGISGNLLAPSIKYQLNINNGFNGYDNSPKLNGKNGLRKGRQKGAESFISSPNFSGKMEYYGIRGLNLGLSAYLGKTQTTLFNGINKDDAHNVAIGDSSVVGISMLGLDARYGIKGFKFRGQFYYSSLTNTLQYSKFTASAAGSFNDLGSSMIGYYAEFGYDVLRFIKSKKQLIAFLRYEYLDTQNSVEQNIIKNDDYQKNAITAGLTFILTKGAVVKADIQFIKSKKMDNFAKTLDLGIGVMF